MRGRTNITQRTGLAVIGNLVTRKQVTGNRIEMGDFVEFTGDTSTWETLSGPFNYQYSKSFTIMTHVVEGEVNNVTFGVFYINPSSSQCKLIVCDKNGIIKITNLSGISFDGNDIDNISFENNKIYVIVNIGTSSRTENKIHIFNYNSSNYSMTYDRTMTVTIPTYPDSSASGTRSYGLLCVKNNKIYCFSTINNTESNQYIYKLNINGSTVEGTYSFVWNGHPYNWKSFIVNKYLFLIATNSVCVFNFDTSTATVTNLGNSYAFPSKDKLFDLIQSGEYFFVSGFYNGNYAKLYVLYLDSNENVNRIDDIDYSFKVSSNLKSLVEDLGNYNYRVILINTLSDSTSNISLEYCLYNFNSNSGVCSLLQHGYLWTGNKIICQNLMLFDFSDVYNFFATKDNISSGLDNYLYRTKFTINNNQIILTESLDLVKKYESVINGVAKTGGNAGQEISVYVP